MLIFNYSWSLNHISIIAKKSIQTFLLHIEKISSFFCVLGISFTNLVMTKFEYWILLMFFMTGFHDTFQQQFPCVHGVTVTCTFQFFSCQIDIWDAEDINWKKSTLAFRSITKKIRTQNFVKKYSQIGQNKLVVWCHGQC